MTEFGFRLKCYANPSRTDGVFIAEEKPIEAYPAASRSGGPVYPPVPDTPYSIGYQVEPEFAAEIVRRWNLVGGMREPNGTVARVGDALAAECMKVFGSTWSHGVRRALARAAIASLKNPPEHVLNALNSYAQCEGYLPEGWNAAIDALLAPTPEPPSRTQGPPR